MILFSDKCLNKEKSFVTFWTAGIRKAGKGFRWQNHLEKCDQLSCPELDVEYTRWYKGDPNNHQGTENCIELRWSPSGFQWVDQKCFVKACVICELLK